MDDDKEDDDDGPGDERAGGAGRTKRQQPCQTSMSSSNQTQRLRSRHGYNNNNNNNNNNNKRRQKGDELQVQGLKAVYAGSTCFGSPPNTSTSSFSLSFFLSPCYRLGWSSGFLADASPSPLETHSQPSAPQQMVSHASTRALRTKCTGWTRGATVPTPTASSLFALYGFRQVL
jgi:hypothetical protein